MVWLPKRPIVVPVDFSDLSFEAIDTALAIAEKPQDIRIIHVLGEMSSNDPGVVWQTVDNESRSRHAEKALKERLADARYQGVGVDIAFGEPGHEIAEFAEGIEAELIVIPSHGRTGLKRLLIGSVAERVVRLSHCPVLVLRR